MKKTAENIENTPAEGLEALVRAMEGVSVLVAGDIMLDRFVYGHVERISPESPVPVLSVGRQEIMLGGAGNALANLKGLGAKGLLLSVAGGDEQGAEVRRLVKEMGFGDSGLLTDPARPTSVKTRYLAGHQQLLRTDEETRTPIADKISGELLKKAEEFLKQAKAVIVSDYGKGMLRRDFIASLVALAKKAGVPVIVDPKGQDFTLYAGADVITPNKKELSDATRGAATASDGEITAAAQSIIRDCKIGAVVATRSKDGMSVIADSRPALHLAGAKNIEVFDVSGAGDTVIATIAAALGAGGTLEQAARLANIAGSIVVTKVGTAPIRSVELRDAVHDDDHGFGGRNEAAVSWDEAAEQARRWRARGLSVGFTNGCFDILHAGHVTYLNEARKNCDRLIVGLNHDASVRLLKGPERPVHDEEARAIVLAGLACVDSVVLFGATEKGGDNTAIKLISHIKPDVYFKGGDYKVEQIPEAPAVQAGGGRVFIMPLVEGQSTTSSIRKIRTEAA